MRHQQQRGGTILGFILGLLIGLGIAFGVAVYVSKIPIPFVNRDAQPHTPPQPNWNPNTALGGKVTPPPVAPAVPATPADAPPEAAPGTAPATATPPASADPLGDLAQAQLQKAQAKAAATDGYQYFVQVGAFRSKADADAQRAKLGLLGQEARVSEREQNGRPVFRVRIGPMDQRAEAEALKKQLDGSGMDAALVRIQR
ncbi:SPOR domain-containing protein [Comamonas nitrativorans]|uniref:SPOR domain-containing protein n=1 Tax=Comamonas nitrativorans TaxID=108437 RepID=A0ABV9H3E2_9BURK